jgi:hypothetical protein
VQMMLTYFEAAQPQPKLRNPSSNIEASVPSMKATPRRRAHRAHAVPEVPRRADRLLRPLRRGLRPPMPPFGGYVRTDLG